MSDEFLPKQRSPESEEVEELISFARVYFATDFPNPSGSGCRQAADIRNLIGERSIPTDPLRQHLFECSNCFCLYREMLAMQEGSILEKSTLAFASPRFRQPLSPCPGVCCVGRHPYRCDSKFPPT